MRCRLLSEHDEPAAPSGSSVLQRESKVLQESTASDQLIFIKHKTLLCQGYGGQSFGLPKL